MNIQWLDNRTKEEVIGQIGKLADAYVPEWKFDPKSPDVGSALALIFADMFLGTIKRYNGIPKKLRREFFGMMGIDMLPSVPADGYVTFGLSSHEFGGAKLQKRTVVTGQSREEERGDIVYETAEELYVTPARISHLFLMDGKEDYIGKKDWKKKFAPFLPEEENLQEHTLYLCQNEILSVTKDAKVYLWLKTNDPKMGQWLSDKRQISIAYASKEGFTEFQDRSIRQEYVELKRDVASPEPVKTKLFGTEGYWIRCKCKMPWVREPFIVKDIRLMAERDQIEPDFIQTGEGEQRNGEFFPFGECPAEFRECYVASGEALSKAGAEIRLTFELSYVKIPFDNRIPVERNWKLIMKRADFRPDPEYDITIGQVVWEYYNGSGFSRLWLGEASECLFDGENAGVGKQIELRFICPKDAALLEWQCAPTRYIRIRALRINNAFQMKGNYITPVIHNVKFHYSYPKEGRYPEAVVAVNGLHRTVFPANALKCGNICWELFTGQKSMERSLYLGFDRPFLQGPVKLFLALEESIREEMPRLSFAYSGKKGFLPLTVTDDTENLRKNGCLTFPCKTDFTPHTVCGETAYWIRITDEKDIYRKRNIMKKSPRIEGLFLNTVKVEAVETKKPEYFSIESGEKNKSYQLLHKNIYDLDVWVNEHSVITPQMQTKMKREGRLFETWDTEGQLSGVWVKWQEVRDFSRSNEEDRHYCLDPIHGIVRFSDGKWGAVPPSSESDTICIRYRCGGGVEGNQPVGGIRRIGSPQGFVNLVTNHLPVCGGYDQETADAAMHRGAAQIRHMDRAVTAGDYEALAYKASRLIQNVKCFPGYNQWGEYAPGCITLVVLQKEFQNGSMYFQRIREEILNDLACHMGGNLAGLSCLSVTEPQFLQMDCYVKIIARDLGHTFDAVKNVERRLVEFLHPVTGNYHGKGWEIGTVPNETQILNALKGLTDISFVDELRTSVSFVSAQECRNKKFAIALSGKHIVEGKEE